MDCYDQNSYIVLCRNVVRAGVQHNARTVCRVPLLHYALWFESVSPLPRFFQELASFVALSGVTEDCINAIIQSNMDGRKIIMCRTVIEMLPLFGLAPEDLQPSRWVRSCSRSPLCYVYSTLPHCCCTYCWLHTRSPKYLLAKDVEKIFDLFDRYRM